MKLIHHLAAVALAVVAAVITVLIWSSGDSPPPATTNAGGSAATSTATKSDEARAPSQAKTRVRVMTREDRQRLREQITAAIRRRPAESTTPSTNGSSGSTAPSLDELPSLRLEDAGPELQAALQEAIPHLADCYNGDTVRVGGPDGGGKKAMAMLTMIADPELGTVIDTEQITDENGVALAQSLETCMRDAIDTLALPGLDKPGALPLQYTFVFD